MFSSRSMQMIRYRCMSNLAATKSRQGLPSAVVSVGEKAASGSLKANEVRVKMIYAPVTLADVYRIQGNISSAGNGCGSDGVGVIEEVGSGVKGLSKGDHVVPGKADLGTWSQTFVASESDLVTVPRDLDTQQAALLGSSAATAYGVLSDVVALNKGDCVIVNGAESSLGQAVIQIAQSKGLKTIAVTGSSNLKEVESKLKGMGSSHVVAEAFAGSSAFRKFCDAEKPKLAIHCASSSKSATDLARGLTRGGTLVAVTGAGRVTVPASILIEKGIAVRGYSADASKASATLAELVKLCKSGALKQTVASTSSLNDIQSAITSVSARTAGSVLLKF